MIIGIPIPHNYLMPIETVKSLANLKYEIVFQEGPYIYMNRNLLIDYARSKNDSILMIDSDMVFTKDDVEKMATSPYPATTGIYLNTRPPYPPMIFKRIEGDYEITQIPKETSPIGACGAGFLHLSAPLIQKLPKDCCNNITENTEHGEDISLCHRINQLGDKIYCNPSIRLGQVRSKVIYG